MRSWLTGFVTGVAVGIAAVGYWSLGNHAAQQPHTAQATPVPQAAPAAGSTKGPNEQVATTPVTVAPTVNPAETAPVTRPDITADKPAVVVPAEPQSTPAAALPDYDDAAVIAFAQNNYPHFYQGDLALFSDNKSYAYAVAEANADNRETPWAKDYRAFLYQLESYNKANIVEEQIKCSSKGCLITGVIADEKHLDGIFDEIQAKNIWSFWVNREELPDGRQIIYIRKGVNAGDAEIFKAQQQR